MANESIHPYLFFGGRCEEALEFYQTALGAEILVKMRHSESPDAPPPGMLKPGFENKIMHSTFRIGNSEVMASDGCGDESSFSGFSLALSAPSEEEVAKLFDALAEGGEVQMPLAPTFFAASFGMVTDRFGVQWLVMAPLAAE